MFFSVVIPTHKRKKLLTELLISLEKQTLDPSFFEVIVVATESDEALSLKESFKSSYKLSIVEITNDTFKGKSASAKRNYGVKISHYPWIAFIDDDCIASPQWLENAKNEIENKEPDMIEGGVHIPEPKKKTLTYKGLKRLSRSEGYQTCNMFYRKDTFLEVGGFDKNFPYYLEDTDLAWTMLEYNKKSIHCKEAQVSHPVPPAQPKKLLDNAFRMEKLVYLAKKHPHNFKQSSMRFFSKAYTIFIINDLILLFSIVFCLNLFAYLFLLRILLTVLYLIKTFKGCSWTLSEVSQTYYYSLICPLISLIYYLKGLSSKHQNN